MSYLFFDPFDHYATGDITEFWQSRVLGTITTGGRCTTNCLSVASSMVHGVTNTHARGLVGFANEPTSGQLAGNQQIWSLGDASGASGLFLFIRTMSDGSIEGWTGVNTVLGTLRITTAAGLLNAGIYSYIEVRWFLHDTLGELEIYHNGVSAGSASGIDTLPSGSGSGTAPWRTGVILTMSGKMDDYSIQNGDGSIHNALTNEGDTHWEARVVETDATGGAGDLAAWTPSTGGDRGAMVDDNPPNDDTDYNESSVVGNRDSHTVPNLVNLVSGEIKAVMILVNAKKTDDISTRSISTVIRQGGSTFDGAAQAVSTAYKYYWEISELDPNTAAAWTVAGFNAMQAGYRDAA
jgi:hypothetical protein